MGGVAAVGGTRVAIVAVGVFLAGLAVRIGVVYLPVLKATLS